MHADRRTPLVRLFLWTATLLAGAVAASQLLHCHWAVICRPFGAPCAATVLAAGSVVDIIGASTTLLLVAIVGYAAAASCWRTIACACEMVAIMHGWKQI